MVAPLQKRILKTTIPNAVFAAPPPWTWTFPHGINQGIGADRAPTHFKVIGVQLTGLAPLPVALPPTVVGVTAVTATDITIQFPTIGAGPVPPTLACDVWLEARLEHSFDGWWDQAAMWPPGMPLGLGPASLQTAVFEHTEAPAVPGGATVAGAWTALIINGLAWDNFDNSPSLQPGSVMRFPEASEYKLDGYVTMVNPGDLMLQLWDTTHGVRLASLGPFNAVSGSNEPVPLEAHFTLAEQTDMQLQYWAQLANAAGEGLAFAAPGINNTYLRAIVSLLG